MTQVLAFARTATAPPIGSSALNADATVLLLLIGLLLGAVLIILTTLGWWKTFRKAGRPGWTAIIPVYNTWVLFEISGKPGWWALLGSVSAIFISLILPLYVGLILPLVLYIVASFELTRRFGKGIVFTIFGLILFPIIGFLILGFGKAAYRTAGANTAPNPPETPTAPPDPPARIIRPSS